MGLAFALLFDPDPSGRTGEAFMKIVLIGPTSKIAADIAEEGAEKLSGGWFFYNFNHMLDQMDYKYKQIRDIDRQNLNKDFHQRNYDSLHGIGPTGYEKLMGLIFGTENPDITAGLEWAKREAAKKEALREHNKSKFKIIIKE